MRNILARGELDLPHRAEDPQAPPRFARGEKEVDAAERLRADVADPDADEFAGGVAIDELERLHRRLVKELREPRRVLRALRVVTPALVAQVELELLLARPRRPRHRHRQVLVPPPHAPLRLARRERRGRHADRLTLPTPAADRLIKKPPAATERAIHERVIHLPRHPIA